MIEHACDGSPHLPAAPKQGDTGDCETQARDAEQPEVGLHPCEHPRGVVHRRQTLALSDSVIEIGCGDEARGDRKTHTGSGDLKPDERSQ